MCSNWHDRTSYDAKRYAIRRGELLDLIGSTCANCGSEELIEFDHIDPSTKEFSITSRWARPFEELIVEAAKCQSLCHDCHKKKSAETASVEHGGGLSGKRNCKCAPCKQRKSEYMRVWKRRNKVPA